MTRVLVIVVVCLGALVSAECPAAAEQAPSTTASTAAPRTTDSPTLTTTTSTPAPVSKAAAKPARPTLAGVRPMQDRSNSSEVIPCTCGIFLSSQCKGSEQPLGLPAMSHEFKRATPNTAYGVRQCTRACVDMIVKHLPNSGPILCSSVDRTVMREKAYLFIKNHKNKWLATRLSAGSEFCCKNGVAVRCPSPR